VKLGVRYQTTYIYDEPVSLSVHEVRLFPRGDHFTRVRALDFRTNTDANVRFGRDVFDNNIASCTFADRVTKLARVVEEEANTPSLLLIDDIYEA